MPDHRVSQRMLLAASRCLLLAVTGRNPPLTLPLASALSAPQGRDGPGRLDPLHFCSFSSLLFSVQPQDYYTRRKPPQPHPSATSRTLPTPGICRYSACGPVVSSRDRRPDGFTASTQNADLRTGSRARQNRPTGPYLHGRWVCFYGARFLIGERVKEGCPRLLIGYF